MHSVSRCLGAYCALFVFTASAVATEPNSFSEETFENVDQFLSERFAESNFGIVIGLIDSEGSRVCSLGKLDNCTEKRVGRDTLFEIGSITKTFTSLLLLEMIKQGEVKRDDPVSQYLPQEVQVPTHGRSVISLYNLASQDSGLPFNADNHVDEKWWEGLNAYTDKDLYVFLSRHKLRNAPGNQFRYSNIGMALLGHALVRHSGEDFESLVINRICKPLGLNDTRITLSAEQQRRLAVGHDDKGDRAPYYDFQVMEPAGSLYSTANDMLKYLSAQLGIIDSQLTPLMKQSQVLCHEDSPGWGDTAMPWFNRGVYEPEGSRFLAHGGGTVGFSTFIGIDTQRKRGVVVLTSQRTMQGNRRILVPAAVGWAVLQGVSLTEWTSTHLVYEAVGLGMELASDDESGRLRISKVFPDSPAGRAGLTEGLIIRKINGVEVQGKSVQECLRIIGSQDSAVVRLEFAHREEAETQSVELKKSKFLTIG